MIAIEQVKCIHEPVSCRERSWPHFRQTFYEFLILFQTQFLEDHQKQLDDVVLDHNSEFESLRETHEAEMADLNANHETQVEKLKENHLLEIQALNVADTNGHSVADGEIDKIKVLHLRIVR